MTRLDYKRMPSNKMPFYSYKTLKNFLSDIPNLSHKHPTYFNPFWPF